MQEDHVHSSNADNQINSSGSPPNNHNAAGVGAVAGSGDNTNGNENATFRVLSSRVDLKSSSRLTGQERSLPARPGQIERNEDIDNSCKYYGTSLGKESDSEHVHVQTSNLNTATRDNIRENLQVELRALEISNTGSEVIAEEPEGSFPFNEPTQTIVQTSINSQSESHPAQHQTMSDRNQFDFGGENGQYSNKLANRSSLYSLLKNRNLAIATDPDNDSSIAGLNTPNSVQLDLTPHSVDQTQSNFCDNSAASAKNPTNTQKSF